MMTESRKLRVFLCHASQDKSVVREVYQRLLTESWVDPWLDEEKLLPGQDWDFEIEKAVETSDAVIVCVSSQSVTKEGYVQKELRKVLDIALEKPEQTIFIIPLRLDECDLPRRLRTLHYVDYFPADQQDRAYRRLLQALQSRFLQLQPDAHRQDVSAVSNLQRDRETPARFSTERALPEQAGEMLDSSSLVLLLIYFAVAAFESFSSSSDTLEILLAVAAALAGAVVLRRRVIPTGVIFKISLSIYLIIYGFGFRLTDAMPVLFSVAGAAAVMAGITLATGARTTRKYAVYSAASLAAFLFLVAAYEIATSIAYSELTNVLSTLIMVVSIIASALLWMEL